MRFSRFKILARSVTVAAAVAILVAARADEFPSRPMTMIVPFAAGGPTDLIGRLMAQDMGKTLGQSVIVENVGGAGGMVGASRVASAAPDGYVMLLGTVGTQAQSQTLYKHPLYDATTDFTPVVLIANVPLVLEARKNLPVADFREFVAYAKAHQAQMQYAAAGSAGQLGCVLFNYLVGVKVTYVPYRGTAPALQDLEAGRVDYLCDIMTTAKPPIEAGLVKGLAVLDSHRSVALPKIPTAVEQGIPGLIAYTWNAIFLPKNAPTTVVKKLRDAAVAAMHSQAVRDRLVPLGAEIAPDSETSPQYLAALVNSEIVKWAKPIKAAGVIMQ
jgi:tripartite-type tricarboxylate transporter receptor subunit TctC